MKRLMLQFEASIVLDFSGNTFLERGRQLPGTPLVAFY